ncbi:Serine-threonine/tyrosine-protein kinase catalytic domain [Arabidopsis thaliana x Arabidopsis arenosa]|uniref:Serine-threonine/tyrosine-protein kinase catalytic domain n=1 Tax=Arabidopsis thaliana x Arabidopsis arenosa TaxID=1240361 RepID=A0A8T1YB70_9BRAS|nr:Serine-threonine/tyrosine-protein kinase catalytic domain [Arabidopsis thaliana x Arabidopsis arenosa]
MTTSLRSVLFWLCFFIFVSSLVPTESDRRVDIVVSIVRQLGYPEEFVKSWQGNDPCQWFGINCQEGIITSITFISLNMSGTISPRFADLTSLQVIDLSHNGLTGTIPPELTKLNLRTLDLSYNRLHGTLPQFRNIVPNIEGNSDIETNRVLVPSPTRNKNKLVVLALLIGIVVGLVVAVGGAFVVYLLKKRKQSNRLPEPNETVIETVIVESESSVIPLQLLRDATEDFDEKNIIGKGGFGSVYRGKLQNGSFEIAVKRMEKLIGGKGKEQFESEVSVLTKVHHRNLVVLHGYCIEGNERLLVYRYMPQGTLSRHLFHWKDEGLKPLEWSTRLTIALDVARGLEYLHSLARQSQSYIHRDLKPSNILLGDDMRARVSDFGLARSTSEGSESIRTKSVLGTYGYMAPEYAVTGRITTKADVYSFGVILMELVTGKEALDEKRSDAEQHIPSWFRKVFINRDSFREAVDETIEVNEENRNIIDDVAKLAIHCCAKEVTQRPEMRYVVSTLTSLTDTGQWKPSEIDEDNDRGDISEYLKRWKEQEMEGTSSIVVV